MTVDPHAKAKEFARRNKLPWKTPPAIPWREAHQAAAKKDPT